MWIRLAGQVLLFLSLLVANIDQCPRLCPNIEEVNAAAGSHWVNRSGA